MGKSDSTLLSPETIAGTWVGNGCICSPECLRIEISPACCGGICVLQYLGSCPVPIVCQFMIPCGNCYCDCDDEGYWTPDENTIDGKCGRGFKRKMEAGSPPVAEDMQR
mmetsp:Transcript_8488/g.17088  ORF Transcript_8488/g.17088 Transcript_8488/m.17088 type:complete len:109 (-) Transcript_8488:297-623(-)